MSSIILVITAGGYVLTIGGMLDKQWGAFYIGLSVVLIMMVLGRMVIRKHGRNKQT